jgi:WD40-like Beta Propeller Repeat
MIARRLTLASLASLCVLAGGPLLAGTAAQAAVVHNYLSQVTEVPAKGPHGETVALSGPLSEARAMTVDSGRLFVADKISRYAVRPPEPEIRLDRFGASAGGFESQLAHSIGEPGELALEFGVAVGHSTGEAVLYAGGVEEGSSEPGVVAVLGESGGLLATWTGADTPSGSFGYYGVNDVAVDDDPTSLLGDWAAGDVYVADKAQNVVYVYKRPEAGGKDEETAPVKEITGIEPGVPFSGLRGVAVDESNGEVFVADGKVVDVFKPSVLDEYEFVRQIVGPEPGVFFERQVNGVAVDGGNGDFYVWEVAGSAVYEFSSEGVYLGRLTGTPVGPFGAVESVAVDPVSHDVYVGDYIGEIGGGGIEAGVVDVFGGDLTVPDVVSEPASDVMVHSATLNGTVDPDGAGEATCQFDWGTSSAFGEVAHCPIPVANGKSPVEVHKGIEGLQPDTTYYYRLQASNGNGTNLGEASQDQSFTTLGPGIHGESVTNVAATSATLNATINPHNAPTTYYFQYGRSSSYEEPDVPAAPGVSIGSGEGDVEVAPHHLQGLTAGTIYHYRVVAVSELEVEPGVFRQKEFDGSDETFTTQNAGAFALPDGREWEMVSPPNKHGALFGHIDEGGVIQAAADGDAMTYEALLPTEAQPQGYSNFVGVLSTRGPTGWDSRDIGIPHETAVGASVGEGAEYRVFSEDLSVGVLQPFGSFIPSLSPEASEQTAYLRTNFLGGDTSDPCAASCYRPLVTGAPGYANVPPGTIFGAQKLGSITKGPLFVGGTPDLSHVVLESDVGLKIPDKERALYEWSGGELALVSVLPPSQGGGPVDGNLGSKRNAGRHAISNDGSRVFWSAEVPTAEGDELHLFVSEITGGQTVQTVQVDTVQGGKGSGHAVPEFQVASSTGSRVFFTDTQGLTSGSSQTRELYECEMVDEAAGKLGCRLTDLGGIEGSVLGASEDGSWVYFVSNDVLAEGAAPGTCSGLSSPAGATCDLYVRHGGATRLVAVLSGEDRPDWSTEQSGGSPGDLTARVSPDGRWLAFMSRRELTGYVTRDAISGRPDEEVYLYDGETGRLVCASCNPTGARPVGVEYGDVARQAEGGLVDGDRVWEPTTWLAANIPGWTPYKLGEALYQSRYLSDSGRLFFNSNDALVPQDVNGTEDVYEYEPSGVGGCSTSSATFGERPGGCVGLISTGTSDAESAFLDASGSGGDVFFLTKSRLVPQDYDNALDVYDAHECTTPAPCFTPGALTPPPCTTGDACKAAPTPQPLIFGAPASATFSGAGNITPSASPPPGVRLKSLTRSQRLARALKACRRKRGMARAACERTARRRYGPGRSRKANVRARGRG